MPLRTLLAISAMLCCNAAVAGLNEGLEALRKQDFATAAKELRPLAERGNAEAQYRIGQMYDFGKGYPQNKAQGIVWFRKAAAQNHRDAQQKLGVIYATGDGVQQDDVEAVAWFRKAATLGNPTAQYNLGLLYAKGQGVKKDYAQAIAWWRKSAAQGSVDAQFKLGVSYHTGQGVEQDPVLALANFTIAARTGNREYVDYRDEIANQLTPEQRRSAVALADAWKVGQPTPGSTTTPGSASGSAAGATAAAAGATVAAAGATAAAAGATAPASAPVTTRCSATGTMGGEKFAANNCVVSLYGDQHSVAIWFNEDPITPAEAENFQRSSYASRAQGGKQRTMAIIMFCPGGGKQAPSVASVKSIDLDTNHAKSPLAGVQWVVESAKDFKVEKMNGDIKPGGTLSGKIVGSRDKTSFTFDFDLNLPAKDAAAGMSCGK